MAFIIYLACLVLGALFVLITAMFGSIFDGDSGNAGADASGDAGVSAFSPTIIAAFLTSFGGLGIILIQFEATKAPIVSAPLAVLGAVIMAGGLVFLMRGVFRHTDSSSESHVADLVGVTATTNSSIPENSVGEIAYIQAGTRYTAPAREENGLLVPAGRIVTITRVVGMQFLVRASGSGPAQTSPESNSNNLDPTPTIT
ncbi:MAG: hypothetical protein EXS27_09800 [Pedosphaera sp.]|nr:hypothetical protein [Pedosphaera sp.]